MKKTIIILLLVLSSGSAFSQAEKSEHRLIALKFKDFYNTDKIDSIYNLFSKEMQAALPSNKAVEFLGGLKLQAGAIKTMEFKKYAGPYASYKTIFEKEIFAVDIALDSNQKVNGFFVKPFVD